MIQSLKRSPVNLRRVLMIPKSENPKALALFLSSSLKLQKLGMLRGIKVEQFVERIIRLRSPHSHYWSWGYSFPWQTRTLVVPMGAPNLVCTTFVANALLDAYEVIRDRRCLEMAASSAAYIADKLYWADGQSEAGFSYPTPKSRSQVHNANFLGAALLCRVAMHNGDDNLQAKALKVARYSSSKQKDDGSWDYGEQSTQRWIDNFHTGYNLCGLSDVCRYAGTKEFDSVIEKGFRFYLKQFFKDDGAPKYFHNRVYPLDIHSGAQSIITLMRFRELSEKSEHMALSVLRWCLSRLYNEKGYFYYQITPHFKNKISYMRWSQAWMLLAMSTFLDQLSDSRDSAV
jgi:hypothetical protein